ncbi:discoidin domain-containing protein [Alteromonadaceae bacterium BrNp21-10]|nr:discoidin domain-containing protein [Alteromonadaceae bacterium BrNp21-10]
MFKHFLSLAIAGLLLSPLQAQESTTQEYVGKITNVFLGKTGSVRLGVSLGEEEYLNCNDSDWPMFFEMGQSYSASWLEFVFQAKAYSRNVRVGYTPSDTSNCSIEYFAIMAGDGESGTAGNGDNLIHTGDYGNVALINTNGLVQANYRASGYYNNDAPAGAFDGYIFGEQINDAAGDAVNRSIWLTKKDKTEGAEEWLEVGFNSEIYFTGFRMMINEKSRALGRGVRNLIVQVSTDGETFEDYEAFQMLNATDQIVSLSTPVDVTHIRFNVVSNYGDSNFIEIDEIEILTE